MITMEMIGLCFKSGTFATRTTSSIATSRANTLTGVGFAWTVAARLTSARRIIATRNQSMRRSPFRVDRGGRKEQARQELWVTGHRCSLRLLLDGVGEEARLPT